LVLLSTLDAGFFALPVAAVRDRVSAKRSRQVSAKSRHVHEHVAFFNAVFRT
jgi:hypothetical protein